jgi:hypothetical protein
VSDIDDLFKLPLAEFTSARNSVAASLKAAGRTDEAAAVKALSKPPLSAWTVNQLYWRHRKPFDDLMALGDRLRKAQAAELTRQGDEKREAAKGEQKGAGGKGTGGKGELRDLIDQRSNALADLAKHAAALLRDSGHPPTPDLIRRITTTLEALATYGNQKGAPTPGRLSTDVEPPGFEALSALMPRSRGTGGAAAGRSRVIPFRAPAKPKVTASKKLSPAARKQQEAQQRTAERKAAEAALREAERALRDARAVVEQRERALRKAAARAKLTEKAKAALERRFEAISAEAEAARQEARRVASAAEDAAQALQDAEQAVEKAKSDVKNGRVNP